RVAATQPTQNGSDPELEAIPPQSIAVWQGASLAVAGGADSVQIDPDNPDQIDLPINIILDLYRRPTEGVPGRLLPPVRFGREYGFGMRLVYLNGGGVNITEGRNLYSDRDLSDLRLPQTVTFRRFEPIGAPMIHLHYK